MTLKAMETLSLQPRRLSALSLTSASDLSSSVVGASASDAIVAVGCSGIANGSAAWRSPATPVAAPHPDDELTCTPEDFANGGSGGAGASGVRLAPTRRVTFVDDTPVRLPYRCVPATTDNLQFSIVKEVEQAAPVTAAVVDVREFFDDAGGGGRAQAVAASSLAAPRRGSSLALQARLRELRAHDGDLADDPRSGDDNRLDAQAALPADPDDPRLADARARAANAAPGERLFAGLRRADVSTGSVDRVAVAESAMAARRPPRCRPPPSLVDQPDLCELWRPEEAASEPTDSGLSGFDASGFLRPGLLSGAFAPPCDTLGCVMRRWTGGNCNF